MDAYKELILKSCDLCIERMKLVKACIKGDYHKTASNLNRANISIDCVREHVMIIDKYLNRRQEA